MAELIDLLPEVIRVTARPASPLTALGEAATDMHAPVVAILDRIEAVIDPQRAPEPLLAALAAWVDLGWVTVPEHGAAALPAQGIGARQLRDLISAAAELSAARGTAAGMARFLELATGVPGFAVASGPADFHVRVTVPAAAAHRADLVGRLVADLKPAHVTSEVLVAPEPQRRSEVGSPAGGDVRRPSASTP